jgi:hypothetical protein
MQVCICVYTLYICVHRTTCLRRHSYVCVCVCTYTFTHTHTHTHTNPYTHTIVPHSPNIYTALTKRAKPDMQAHTSMHMCAAHVSCGGKFGCTYSHTMLICLCSKKYEENVSHAQRGTGYHGWMPMHKPRVHNETYNCCACCWRGCSCSALIGAKKKGITKHTGTHKSSTLMKKLRIGKPLRI